MEKKGKSFIKSLKFRIIITIILAAGIVNVVCIVVSIRNARSNIKSIVQENMNSLAIAYGHNLEQMEENNDTDYDEKIEHLIGGIKVANLDSSYICSG